MPVGGSVQLSEGTFSLAAGLTMKNNYQKLHGQGMSTYLNANIAGVMLTVDPDSAIALTGVEIVGMRLRNDGNGTIISVGPSNLSNANRFVIRDIDVTGNANLNQFGIMTKQYNDSVVENCFITNVGTGLSANTILRSIYQAIKITSCTDSAVDTGGNLFESVFGGIVCDLAYLGNGIRAAGVPRNFSVVNCKFYRHNQWAFNFYVKSSQNTDNPDITVVNCHAYSGGQSSDTTYEADFTAYSDNVTNLERVKRIIFIGCTSQLAQGRGFDIRDSTQVLIRDCLIRNNGQKGAGAFSGVLSKRAGIYLGATPGAAGTPSDNVTITGCHIYDDQGTPTQTYGVFEDTGCDHNSIYGNYFAGNVTAHVAKVGANTVVHDNKGYATERSGTATVNSGAITAVVNHGLVAAPTRVFITATLWSNATKAWITTITATQFTINVDADPGAGTATFDWRAIVGEENKN